MKYISRENQASNDRKRYVKYDVPVSKDLLLFEL